MVNVLKFMHLSMHVYNGVLDILSSLNVLLGWSRGAYLARWFFSHLISEVADFVWENGRHGIQLLPGLEKTNKKTDPILLPMFADNVVLVSPTPPGLQSQMSNLQKDTEHSYWIFGPDCYC